MTDRSGLNAQAPSQRVGTKRSVDDSENVLLGQQHVLITTQLDVGTGVLAVENLVSNAHFRGLTGTVIVSLAGTHLNHLAHLGLLFGGVGQKDATGGPLFRLRHFDENAISKGLDGGDAEGNSCHG